MLGRQVQPVLEEPDRRLPGAPELLELVEQEPAAGWTRNQSLGELYRSNIISFDEAMAHSVEPAELERVIRQS